MKSRFLHIILSVLILSFALQTITLPALARSEPIQSQAEIEVPIILPENRLISFPDYRDAQPYPEDEIVFDCETVNDVSIPECEALVDLYQATNGDNWLNNSGWVQSPRVADWDGVTVTEDSGVTQLTLSYNILTGSIPSTLGDLSNLMELYLDNNQLTGSIPAELGKMSNLRRLRLENNRLTGSIPSELGNLSMLRYLYLNKNLLTGSIPMSFINLINLYHFYASETNLCEPAMIEFDTWKSTVFYWYGTGIICTEEMLICLPLIFR